MNADQIKDIVREVIDEGISTKTKYRDIPVEKVKVGDWVTIPEKLIPGKIGVIFKVKTIKKTKGSESGETYILLKGDGSKKNDLLKRLIGKEVTIFLNVDEDIDEASAQERGDKILVDKSARSPEISKVRSIVKARIKAIEKQPGNRKITNEKYKLQSLLKKLEKKSITPIGETITEANSEPPMVSSLRKIVDTHSAKSIKCPTTGKSLKVDVQSANAVVRVYDGLKPANQEKFTSAGLGQMIQMAWKLVSK